MEGQPLLDPSYVQHCRKRYGPEPPLNDPLFDHLRVAGNRSFPTGYPIIGPSDAAIRTAQLRAELGITTANAAAMATAADRRVFTGPSDEDVAALPHIEDAWAIAEALCDRIKIRTTSGRNPHVRYGLMLDWFTRDMAKQAACTYDRLAEAEARARYGHDPHRVAVDHGVDASVIVEYVGRLTGSEPSEAGAFEDAMQSRRARRWLRRRRD